MIIDDRPAHYQGDLDWNALLALIEAYDTPDGQWQALAQGPEGFALRVTRGAHQGSFYPAYKTNYYFDFRTEDATGVSAFDYHALLNADGTAIIGIDPAL
jgi:hypothetical protein